MDDINKIHKILSAKKFKYKFTSLIVTKKSLIVDFVPLNAVSNDYLSETVVLDQEKSVQSYLPTEIGEKNSAVAHIRPEIKAYCLRNVLVVGNSSFCLTTKKDKIFYEKLHHDNRLIYLYDDSNISFHSASLAKIKNLPIISHQFDAIYFGGTFITNYYHFLVETLAKTQHLSKIPDHKNLTIVLDISIQQNENLKTLADFFLKDYKKIYIENSSYHSFKKIWYVTTPNPTVPNIREETKYEAEFSKIDPESISYLRAFCLKNYDESKVGVKPIKKIFIARKSIFRKYNEPELLDIAKKYGFEPVYFEELNMHEQIFMVKNAEYIVGSSGAAWTNLIFAEKNAKGLMWLGTVWGDFSVFSTLAKLVNFNLYTMRHQSVTNYFHEDYILDGQDFENNMIKLLEL